MGTELLRAKDAHDRDLVFAPTHEEAVTSLASTCVLSHRSLPLRLYQVRKGAHPFLVVHCGIHLVSFLI